MIDDLPCAVCQSESTETGINADYRGSAKLRVLVTVDCSECDSERTYVDSFNYIRS